MGKRATTRQAFARAPARRRRCGGLPRSPRLASVATALLLLFGLGSYAQTNRDANPWKNLPLTEALARLRDEGLVIVFTSQTVRSEMLVTAEPAATSPAAILREILAPNGLAAEEDPPGVFVIVARRTFAISGVIRSPGGSPIAGAEIRIPGTSLRGHSTTGGGFSVDGISPGDRVIEARAFGFVPRQTSFAVHDEDVELGDIILAPAPAVHEEIVVQPSQLRLLETEPTAPLDLSREEIDRLPHLGGDFLRAVSLLPGTAANDITAQFNVHGGRRDEVQILLDGQELYEAFHLKDYDNALSIIADENLSLARLSTGAFPASYGDRMSGVLDLTTVAPAEPLTTRLTASVTSLSALSSGRFSSHPGGWVLSARSSSQLIPHELIRNVQPSFWDAFAKLELDLSPRQNLTARILGAGDRLTEQEVTETGVKDFDTEYNSLYAWLIDQAIVGGQALVRTSLSWSSIDRDRRGFENDDTLTFRVRDLRDLEVTALAQSWDIQISADHVLRFGAEARHFDAGYDYLSVIEDVGDDEDEPAPPDADMFSYGEEPSGEHYAVWITDRFNPIDALTLEAGLRFDKHSLTDDSLTSPRLNAAWRLTEGAVLRASWGVFHQTQRPYELQVEDRETRFFEPEKSEHIVLAFERLFQRNRGIHALRIEAYSRRISNPRPRFENLIEPINTFPEIEPDRVRIVPQKGRADGVELLARGSAGTKVDWGLMYAWARSEDLVDDAWRPRRTDQRHTFTADCNLRLTDRWNMNLAFRYHTGWPTTEILSRSDEDGDYSLAFGPYDAERLADYHRLDLRVARDWRTKRGLVTLYLDVQNLYDRDNPAGFDAAVDPETGDIEVETENWPGILPSLGISWQF